MVASQPHILTQEEGQKFNDYGKMWLLCLLTGTKEQRWQTRLCCKADSEERTGGLVVSEAECGRASG